MMNIEFVANHDDRFHSTTKFQYITNRHSNGF